MPISSYTNKIIKGDCIKVLKKLPDACVDLIFADPPYNLQLEKELYRPNETKVEGVDDGWDKFSSFAEYDAFSNAWMRECQRILKPTGSFWVIGSYHNIFRVGTILQDIGFWILNDIIWVKSNPMPNFRGTRFNNAHETLIWCAKNKESKPVFNYKTMKAFNDDKQMRSDWTIPICLGNERLKDKEGNKIHSTQKPEALLYRVILSSSKKDDIVLDPFMGSGTTGAVAKRLGRTFIGIEKEAQYIKEAKKRIQDIQTLSKDLLVQSQEIPKPKVPFGNLITYNYIVVGETLYSHNKKHWAKVMADGTVKNGKYFGSIHAVSAQMLNKQSNNGWLFWNVNRDNEMISIDSLREKYAKELITS